MLALHKTSGLVGEEHRVMATTDEKSLKPMENAPHILPLVKPSPCYAGSAREIKLCIKGVVEGYLHSEVCTAS